MGNAAARALRSDEAPGRQDRSITATSFASSIFGDPASSA